VDWIATEERFQDPRRLRLYSSKIKSKTKPESKKSIRKSTTRDERSSDIYRMNPWKRLKRRLKSAISYDDGFSKVKKM